MCVLASCPHCLQFQQPFLCLFSQRAQFFLFFPLPHIFIEIQTNISPYMVLILVDIFVVLFFPFLFFCATIIKKQKQCSGSSWLITPRTGQTDFRSDPVMGCGLQPPTLVWFSRGLTFSTPAAALSGMFHTPLFSQQEKPQAAEISF